LGLKEKPFCQGPGVKFTAREGTHFPAGLLGSRVPTWDNKNRRRKKAMRTLILCLAAISVLAITGCTSLNNCSGNGYANPGYCTGTLHPNAGPYAGGMMHAG
jgi:hypothetical protein